MAGKSRGFSLLRTLGVILLGVVVGGVTRFAIFGTSSNEAIMSSFAGLLLFCVIALGLFGVLGVIRVKAPQYLSMPLLALVSGIMWVIPFPH